MIQSQVVGAPTAQLARYAVLYGSRYYPDGWGDYVGRSDDLQIAHQIGREYRDSEREIYGWVQIIDLVTCAKLYDTDEDPEAEDIP